MKNKIIITSLTACLFVTSALLYKQYINCETIKAEGGDITICKKNLTREYNFYWKNLPKKGVVQIEVDIEAV